MQQTQGAPTFACTRCGGTIARTPYEPEVKCPYCGVNQPNRLCLLPGEEVLVGNRTSAYGFALARVTACEGPDDVRVSVRDEERSVRLASTIPVVSAAGNARKGSAVYARFAAGWARTWMASDPQAGVAKVKHYNNAFQDSFFDERMNEMDLRVDARPSARATRTGGQAFLQRLRDDPFGTMITGCIAVFVIGLFVVGVVVAFAAIFH